MVLPCATQLRREMFRTLTPKKLHLLFFEHKFDDRPIGLRFHFAALSVYVGVFGGVAVGQGELVFVYANRFNTDHTLEFFGIHFG